MSWNNTALFMTSDLLAREGELLSGLPFANRHEVVKHVIEERIKARFAHLDDPLDEISDPQAFSQAAICLNLALVFRENSSRKDDIFAVRAEFYQRRYEEELGKAFASLKLEDEDAGVELVR